MRVALVHYSAPPVIGGVEGILGAHARVLREAGHDVSVVTGRGDGVMVPELDSRHPEVERVTAELAQGRISEAYLALRSRLSTALEPALSGRVVVAHNLLTMPFNLAAAEALLERGGPLVAWTHDLAWTMERYRRFRRPGRPWDLMGSAQPGCRYVAVSRARARELKAALGARRVDVVPNGVDAHAFIGLPEATQELVRGAGMLSADPLILVPSRITSRKRLELAVEVAAELGREMPKLRLAISGPLGAHSPENAAYARELEELSQRLGCPDKVIFMRSQETGAQIHPVKDEDVPGLYRLADLVLLPSESEGFGLVLLEAGLARTPVLCADLPVLREVGGSGTWRFRAGAGAAEVAALCRRALATRSAKLRRRARAHDWNAILPRIEAVLEGAARA